MSAIEPPSLVQGQLTTVTIHGRGFAYYGEGQTVARIGGSSTLVPCRLLSSERLECTFSPSSWARRRLAAGTTVAVSLSGAHPNPSPNLSPSPSPSPSPNLSPNLSPNPNPNPNPNPRKP